MGDLIFARIKTPTLGDPLFLGVDSTQAIAIVEPRRPINQATAKRRFAVSLL
jgi:hypothetical protein